MGLTVKQRRFIDSYLEHFNATRAARDAGYSEKSAHHIGWENLRKPDIAEVIKQRLEADAMSAEEALHRLARVARGEFGGGFKITTSEMIRALELIGKAHGMFRDTVEHTGADGEPLEIIVRYADSDSDTAEVT